jgi:hypothetical protein
MFDADNLPITTDSRGNLRIALGGGAAVVVPVRRGPRPPVWPADVGPDAEGDAAVERLARVCLALARVPVPVECPDVPDPMGLRGLAADQQAALVRTATAGLRAVQDRALAAPVHTLAGALAKLDAQCAADTLPHADAMARERFEREGPVMQRIARDLCALA